MRLSSFCRRLLVPACACILLSADVWSQPLWPDLSSPPKAVGGGEKDAAVIVGAQNYAFVEHVPGAAENADDWQAYLTETLKVPVDRVILLKNDDATVEQMRDAAARAAGRVKDGGTLWFIFIGHGAPSKDGKDGLLVGVDAQQKAQSVYTRSFSRNELLRLLAKGKQARTIVLLDACFSGRTQSGQALVAGLQPLITARSLPPGIDKRLILMTAARSDQFAGSLPGAARPAFTYLALGALRGWAADVQGAVTASGIVAYARKVLSLARDREQTPELSTPATAGVILGGGHEAGPNLAKIERDMTSAGPNSAAEAAPKPAPVPREESSLPSVDTYADLNRWEVLDGHWEQRPGALCGSGGHVILKEQFGDHAFQVKAERVAGPTWPATGFGIRNNIFAGGQRIFRSGTSGMQGYALNFTNDGTYDAFTGIGDQWYPRWADWQHSDAIDSTRNILRVEAQGDHISYFFNGREVYDFHDGTHRSGSPMLWVQTLSQTVCFSDFTINSL